MFFPQLVERILERHNLPANALVSQNAAWPSCAIAVPALHPYVAHQRGLWVQDDLPRMQFRNGGSNSLGIDVAFMANGTPLLRFLDVAFHGHAEFMFGNIFCPPDEALRCWQEGKKNGLSVVDAWFVQTSFGPECR